MFCDFMDIIPIQWKIACVVYIHSLNVQRYLLQTYYNATFYVIYEIMLILSTLWCVKQDIYGSGIYLRK